MMKARQPRPSVLAKAEFLLQLVALDPPAQLGQIDQTAEPDILRKRGEPVCGWLRFALW